MTITIYYPNQETKVFKNVVELSFDKSHIAFKKKNVKSYFEIPVYYFNRIEIEG